LELFPKKQKKNQNTLFNLKEYDTFVFRLLYNTYKEYFFIFVYRLLVNDYKSQILHSFDVFEGIKIKEKNKI